jgi:anti-sigma B factor antagonist
MEITEDQEGSVTIIEVKGRIDSNTSKVFGDRLTDLLKAGRGSLIIDMRDIIYISSAGFRVLLVAGKVAEERNSLLALCNLSPQVKRLFDLGDFTDLFQIYPSRQDGIANLAS